MDSFTREAQIGYNILQNILCQPTCRVGKMCKNVIGYYFGMNNIADMLYQKPIACDVLFKAYPMITLSG